MSVTAYGLYPQAVQRNLFFSLASFLAGVFHPAAPAPTGLELTRRRGGLPLLQVGVAAGLTALPQLRGGVPKGYVRVLVFNADSVLVEQRVQALSKAALNNYQALRLQVVVPTDGYVTAYVGNESDVDVYFDDVSVELRPGLQVQETHYDPAGLELAGLSGTTPGLKCLSQYRWNGKEFQPDLGLSWNHQDWRFFDPQLLGWHVVDPEVENGQESWTPYSFGFDNAVRYADADGRCPGGCPPSPFDGLSGGGNAASSPDLLSAIATPFTNFVGDFLTLTDVNDAVVIATTITRGNEAINADDSPATGWDKGFAVAGALLPAVSGSAVKKVGTKAIEAVGNYATGPYGKMAAAKLKDAHHIIQDAAVKYLPGYDAKKAQAVQLSGPSTKVGSPHHAATQVQRSAAAGGKTYGSERKVAYRALRAAGVERADAKALLSKADEYFKSIGVNSATPTRVPGNRR